MGALFNTPGTLAIMQALSTAYQGKKFIAFSKNATHKSDLVSNMASYDFAVKYGLVVTGRGSSSINSHWQAWLDYFDANDNVGVRQDMANTLNAPGRYTGIEFFAVPATQFNVQQPRDFADTKYPGMFTRIITLETPTYDNL